MEALIRVGLILPDDKTSMVTLQLTDTIQGIFADDKPVPMGNKLDISTNGENLQVGNVSARIVRLKGPGLSGPDQKLPSIFPVSAGRKFHWETEISISIPGDLELSVRNGFILAVNIVNLEDYLACVATSEMSSNCPMSYLEAQTISARSWVLAGVEAKHQALGINVCNDDCCQRYQGAGSLSESSFKATRATTGRVLVWNGRICDARYSKSCGGILEDFATAWNTAAPEYLVSHPDSDDTSVGLISSERDAEEWITNSPPECYCSHAFVPEDQLKNYIGTVDRQTSYYRWRKEYSGKELLNIINRKTGLKAQAIREMSVLKRGSSGRISKLKITYQKDGVVNEFTLNSELEVRQTLHDSTLFSSAIVLDLIKDDSGNISKINITGAGWGHGVGLCQIGALGMALKGSTCQEILDHYYPGTSIKKLNEMEIDG